MDLIGAGRRALILSSFINQDTNLAVSYLYLDKQLDDCKAESESRLNSYLAQIEAAQVVIEHLNDHIKMFVEPLKKENAELKAKIADHIRAKDKVCSTLCHPDEECSITENGKCEAKGE